MKAHTEKDGGCAGQFTGACQPEALRSVENNRGNVTLFTCLLLASFMIFVMFVLEVVCWQMAQARAEQAVDNNIKSLFGDYVRCIYEDYHLLVIDGSYQTGSMAYLEERLEEQLSENLQGSLSELDIQEVMLTETVSLTDEHFAALKQQLHDYCGYAMTEDLMDIIKKRSQGVAEEETETAAEQEEVEVDADTLTNPLSFFNGMVGNILLSTVCPSGKFPSQQVIGREDLPSVEAGISGESSLLSLDFLNGTGISELLNLKALDLSGQVFSTENVELAFYIRNCFHTWIDEETDRDFMGEQEYILYGNDTDRDNVLQAVQGIILLRMPFNYSCLCSLPSKRTAIKTAAKALAVLTGTSSAFVEKLLLAAVSYGESILDVKALMRGEAVPLVKTADKWRLGIAEFLKSRLSGKSVESTKEGLFYEDYLTLLLLLKGSEDKLYYRMLDLITLAARKENEGFNMEYAITGASVQYSIEINAKFSSLPKSLSPESYYLFYEKSLSY